MHDAGSVIFFILTRCTCVSTTLPRLDEPGDAELISAVRGGDVDAYGELFSRHVEAARRLARQLVSSGDADDLVSEAFAKVLVVLQRGGGPDLAFRAYLLTAVRRLHVDKIRAGARLHTTGDLTPFDPGVPFRDTAVEGFESAAAARAFASLPERWQTVLWHTEVEGQKPAEVAPLLGMSANSVSALAYRAREGLRQAFLEMHLQDADGEACAWTHRNLGAYIRNGIARRDASRVEDHLTECRQCTAIYLELSEVNSNLSGILAPALLGGALAAGYLSSSGAAGGAVAQGGLFLLLGRARDLVATHASTSAIAGVAATAVLGGAVLMTIDRGPSTTPDSQGAAASPGTQASGGGDQGRAEDRAGRTPGARDDRARGARDDEAGGAVLDAGELPLPVDPPDLTGPDTPPDGQPTQSSPNPTAEPTSPIKDPEPDPSPSADLGVRASASSDGPGIFTVVVSVGGLDDGTTARLAVTGSGVAVVTTGDRRCGLLEVGSGSCEVDRSPTTFEFSVVAEPTGSSSLTFTVVADGPNDDPDSGNNSTTVRLRS